MSTPLVRELGLEETDAPIILVLGETGAGKSYFINALVPGSVQIGYHSESCIVIPSLSSPAPIIWQIRKDEADTRHNNRRYAEAAACERQSEQQRVSPGGHAWIQ